jgi:hypothetical protein
MKTLLLSLLIILFLTKVSGSGFDLYIHPPAGVTYRSFASTQDGGFILCGDKKTSLNSDSTNFYFERYDSTGNLMWSKQYYDTIYFSTWGIVKYQANEIVTALNGGFMFVGTIYDSTIPAAYVAKLDSNGNLIHSFVYWGNVHAWGDQIRKCTDSTYVYTFHEYEGAGNGYEGYMKTDDNLDTILFEQHIYGIAVRHALSILPDNSVYSLVDGSDQGASSIYSYSPTCFRIDPNGNFGNDFIFGYSPSGFGTSAFDYDFTHSITGTTDHGMLIAGRRNLSGNEDISIMHVDSMGDSLWTKYYGGIRNDNAFDIIYNPDSGFVLTGYSGDTCTSPVTDILLMKLDQNADSVWSKTFKGTTNNGGLTVQNTDDGGFMIFGYSDTLTRIIKTDANGNITSPFSLSINNPCVNYCTGDTAVLSVNQPNASYHWSTGNTSSSIYVTTSGLYSVVVTANGVHYPLFSPFLSFTTQPSTSFTSDTVHFCDSYVASSSSSAIPGYSYQWYRNDTLIPFATSSTYTISENGKYSVIVSGVCGTDSAHFIAFIHHRPAQPIITPSGFTTICAGDTLTISTSATAVNYQWLSGFSLDTIQGATNSSYDVVLQTGNSIYFVIVSDVYGCTNMSNPVPIMALTAQNNVPVFHPITTQCDGDTVMLSVGSSYTTYIWSNGDTNYFTYVTQPGNYSVVMNQGMSCESHSSIVSVNFYPPLPINSNLDTMVCKNTVLLITPGPASGYTYQWQDSTHANPYQVNTTLADTLLMSIRMEDLATLCTAVDTFTVIVDECLGLSETDYEMTSIYPNPAESFIELSGEFNDGIEVEILSSDGKIVRQAKLNVSEKDISLTGISSGIYYVRVNKTKFGRFIKE